MKRLISITLSTLAIAATGAQAVQPSFMDYVPLETGGNASAGSSSPTLSRNDLPQPSFVDYVAIEADESTARSGIMTSRHELPRPSFVDYPDGSTSGPLHAGQPSIQARSR